jgi:hypothetical protein
MGVVKLTDWIIAGAAILQAASAVVICFLTSRYVAMQSEMVTLQKSVTKLQETIVQWQTRIKVQPLLHFQVADEHDVNKPGLVRLRVGNLSAIGVWLDSVDVLIIESAARMRPTRIQIDDVLAPNTSWPVDIWTVIDDYGKQYDVTALIPMNVKVVVTCLVNSEKLELTQECRFHYTRRNARNFEVIA